MTLVTLIISILLLTGCNKFLNIKSNSNKNYFLSKNTIENTLNNWNYLIKQASYRYNIDEKLIKSIIYAESSGNPYAKSSSNAIGLMQIKANSAGAEIYRINGKKGQPSIKSLYNPKININIGTAYINLLQKKNCLVSKIKI